MAGTSEQSRETLYKRIRDVNILLQPQEDPLVLSAAERRLLRRLQVTVSDARAFRVQLNRKGCVQPGLLENLRETEVVTWQWLEEAVDWEIQLRKYEDDFRQRLWLLPDRSMYPS